MTHSLKSFDSSRTFWLPGQEGLGDPCLTFLGFLASAMALWLALAFSNLSFNSEGRPQESRLSEARPPPYTWAREIGTICPFGVLSPVL